MAGDWSNIPFKQAIQMIKLQQQMDKINQEKVCDGKSLSDLLAKISPKYKSKLLLPDDDLKFNKLSYVY
jgi:hypothetical protein